MHHRGGGPLALVEIIGVFGKSAAVYYPEVPAPGRPSQQRFAQIVKARPAELPRHIGQLPGLGPRVSGIDSHHGIVVRRAMVWRYLRKDLLLCQVGHFFYASQWILVAVPRLRPVYASCLERMGNFRCHEDSVGIGLPVLLIHKAGTAPAIVARHVKLTGKSTGIGQVYMGNAAGHQSRAVMPVYYRLQPLQPIYACFIARIRHLVAYTPQDH